MGQSSESTLPIKAVLVLFCKSFKENLVTFDKMAKGCDGKEDSDCIVPKTNVAFVVVTKQHNHDAG